MPAKRSTPAFSTQQLADLKTSVSGAAAHLASVQALLQSPNVLPSAQIADIVHSNLANPKLSNQPDTNPPAYYYIQFLNYDNVILPYVHSSEMATAILDDIGSAVDLSGDAPTVKPTTAPPSSNLGQVIY